MKKDPTLQQAHDTMRFFRRGGSLRMLLDDDVTQPLNTVYRYAMQLMEVKEFAGAARLFQLLTIYDAWSFDYWFRLGECCQAQKHWGKRYTLMDARHKLRLMRRRRHGPQRNAISRVITSVMQ